MRPEFVKSLEALVGRERVSAAAEDRVVYSYDGTWTQSLPDVVVSPATTEHVSTVLCWANDHGVPVVPRGAGTGLSGGSVPAAGGICMNLAPMNRILEISTDDMVAVVQPGVVNAALQQAVEEHGLFYPPDPASMNQSTIGGNIAENAGGPRCLKYGVTRDYVMALEVVLPTGEVLRTGSRALKNVTGLNLVGLFVGSEGLLGVITEATLRLVPKPSVTLSAMAAYPQLEGASHTMAAIMRRGIIPCALELMDSATIQCVEQFAKLGLPTDVEAVLLISQDGPDHESVLRQIHTIAEACRESGARDVTVAATQQEHEALWAARRSVSPSLARMRPNKLGEDISVPPSKVPEALRELRRISERYSLPIPVFGHIGDGNLHPNILCDRRDPDEMRRVDAAAREILELAVRLGGTLSGEHGIGLSKRHFLPLDLSPESISLQRRIKRLLDPNNILNPGKVFPEN
ncbi:MAG: FAD-binding oxidoreductase [Armatimonadota bacterium]